MAQTDEGLKQKQIEKYKTNRNKIKMSIKKNINNISGDIKGKMLSFKIESKAKKEMDENVKGN